MAGNESTNEFRLDPSNCVVNFTVFAPEGAKTVDIFRFSSLERLQLSTNLLEDMERRAVVSFVETHHPLSEMQPRCRQANPRTGATRQRIREAMELRVSQGAVVWIPAVKWKGRRLNWDQLDDAFKRGKRVRVGF